jgi:hypothetical protein
VISKEYVDKLASEESFVRRPQNAIEVIAAGIPPDCKCDVCINFGNGISAYDVMKVASQRGDDAYLSMCFNHLLVIWDREARKKTRLEKCMERLHEKD